MKPFLASYESIKIRYFPEIKKNRKNKHVFSTLRALVTSFVSFVFN